MYLRYLSHTFTCIFTPLVLGLLATIKCSLGASQVAQFRCSVVSNSLWPDAGRQHARLPCPSSSPGVHSNSCPLSRWCHPGLHSGKESACQSRRCKRCGFDPWVGKIPWSGNGNVLQYSCLNTSVDRRAWWPTVPGSQRAGHDWVRAHTRRAQGCPWMNRSF